MKDNKQYSVVVPVYNEEKFLEEQIDKLYATLKSANKIFEVIVVDDGSVDNTGHILNNLKRDNLKVFTHENNKGYGATLKTGIKRSKYENIIIIDADGSYRPEDMKKIINSYKKFDMVVGARTGKNAKHALIRRPAKWFLRKLAEYLSGSKIPDLNSGLRIFKKDIVEKYIRLFPEGFSFTTTITLITLCNDYKVKFVPIEYLKRIGKSKIRPIRDTVNFLGLIFRMTLYFNPIKIFGPISIILLLTGVVFGVYKAVTVQNVPTVAVIILLTGFQIGVLGLLADLIDKRV